MKNMQQTKTNNAPNIIPVEEDIGEQHEVMNNCFCFAALADKQTGTLYTDATGALPAVSLEGNQYYFVAYDYDTNAIFAEPLQNLQGN